MQWWRRRCAKRAPTSNMTRIVVATFATLALAGCNTDGQPSASISAPRGASVAFDSIDGPPPALFQKLVQNLNDAAQARHLPVVSRETESAYRVRGYIATHTARGRISVSWLWDVYDGEKNRALRIRGVQALPGKHRNAWAAIDDATVQHIAQASMDQLAAFLTSPNIAPGAPAAGMVYAGDRSPEASGIFRIFQANADPTPAVEAEDGPRLAGPIPLPPRRSQTAARIPAVVAAATR